MMSLPSASGELFTTFIVLLHKPQLMRLISGLLSSLPAVLTSPSPSAVRLVAGRLTVHENSRYLEVDRRGWAPAEACERWLLASPAFLLAPASRSRSFLHLQPELDQAADGFGASGRFVFFRPHFDLL